MFTEKLMLESEATPGPCPRGKCGEEVSPVGDRKGKGARLSRGNREEEKGDV